MGLKEMAYEWSLYDWTYIDAAGFLALCFLILVMLGMMVGVWKDGK